MQARLNRVKIIDSNNLNPKMMRMIKMLKMKVVSKLHAMKMNKASIPLLIMETMPLVAKISQLRKSKKLPIARRSLNRQRRSKCPSPN